MLPKIPEILARDRPVLSFEVYPPKTARGLDDLYAAIENLATLKPDYASVTYRAGGSSAQSTLAISTEIQRRHGIPVMHHLTLVGQTKDQLRDIIKLNRDSGIRNILALRGDPTPEMNGVWRKVDGGLEYSYELIDLIRDVAGDYFGIGVAGFPEGHIACPSKDLDSRYLKMKIDHGGEFVVTQLFFDNAVYSEYLDRLSREGVMVPVVPGLLPITDYAKLLSFCETCGAYICEEVHRVFRPIAGDPAQTLEKGAEFATVQAVDLLARGAPGIHFYSLNKAEPVRTIWRNLKDSIVAKAA